MRPWRPWMFSRTTSRSLQPPAPGKMRAIVYRRYGPPDVLELTELDRPTANAGEVLVQVVAAAVNPGDWDFMHGTPYILRPMIGLRRPRDPILGLAIAGRVEAAGTGATTFRVGDEVAAEVRRGGFAEFVSVPSPALVDKPARVTFEQAAAMPVVGTTALKALRDVARLQPGQSVLVNGAAGGVGTFAVQIAKGMGAEVTGVCSAASVALLGSIGADHVIDYTAEDFTRSGRRYDVILDNVGNRSPSELRRALSRTGILLTNSNKGGGRWIGRYIQRAGQAMVLSPFVSQRLRPMAAPATRDDLAALMELADIGKVTPVIDRRFPLAQVADALRYYGTGHAHGKVIISIAGGATHGCS
jgi:NADPH:quinone reductase-like Zn-dependent oxidoreductase